MRGAVLAGLLLVATDAALADSCSTADLDDTRRSCFDSARQCALIKADNDRLDCFDRVFADTSAVTSAAADARGPVPVELTASPEEYAQRNAGSTRNNRIESTIVAITTNAHNIEFLKLENGHTWRENEDSRVRFRTGRKVTIEQGLFGAFNLTMQGAPRPVKVKRIE